MHWLAVIFDVDADRAETFGDALLEAGALSVDVADAAAGTPQERPVFDEPGAASARGWDRNRDRKSTRLNSSHIQKSRMPSSA